jgi:transcriptional antiterminator RfaH
MATWYAMRTKPNKEDVVWRQIAAKNIPSFFPRLRVRPINPRSRKVRPYFPGYLFVHVDLDEVRGTLFKWLPDAVGLVSFDGKPAPVEASLIESLQAHLDRINSQGGLLYDGLKTGDSVVITSGPLAGYDAIFDAALPGKERVRLLLSMLGRQTVAVEMDAARVKPRRRQV